MDEQTKDRDPIYEKFVGYFRQGVLSNYESQPDKYVVETDFFEGHITLTTDYAAVLWDSDNRQEGIDVQFGYRTLNNGELAIAVYMPSLMGYSGQPKKSQAHQRIWRGFLIERPDWTTEADGRFSLWVRRTFEGDWDVENGPRQQLEVVIQTINALTSEVLGCSLFKFSKNPALRFPSAQNTHQYQDAHRELYGYVIDGLDKPCIDQLASRTGGRHKLSDKKTVEALRLALPRMPPDTGLWSSLQTVSAQRREAGHSVRPAAIPFGAFEQFNLDLEAVVAGLRDLLLHLEGVLKMSGEAASERQAARSELPKIDRSPERAPMAHYSINQIRYAEGKTIERVQYGFTEPISEVHESEVIILHFTDGSTLGISTGSNALNLSTKHEGLLPGDIHVDFMLQWVPPPTDP